MVLSQDISVRIKLVFGAVVLLILTLAFNMLLSLSSLDKLYAKSLSSRYKSVEKDSRTQQAGEHPAIRDLSGKIHHTALKHHLGNMAIIIGSALILLTAINIVRIKGSYFSEKHVFIAISVIVILSQIIFSCLNIGYVSGMVASEYFRDILLDSATVLLISVFFFVEMLILFSQIMERNLKSAESEVHYGMMRPVIFILLFGTEIAFSFIPIYMEKIYAPMLGLSKNVILGLPVSVSVFCAGVSFFMAGIWHDRRGWHEPFLAGTILTAMGLLYSWLAPDAIQFIISRAVSGTGYGLFFMASQGFVISYSDKNSKAHGLAILFAALYAGIICGNATGAMLSEHIGYRPVFLIGAIFVFCAICYTLVFMRHAIRREKAQISQQPHESLRIKEFFRFLSDRNVFALIFLSSIPANMAMIGFGNYFNPLYLSRIGTSQSDIGRIFIIYGIFLIYIGPLLSKLVDGSKNQKLYIAAGGIIGSLAFASFYFFDGLPASLMTMTMLGFSHSFVFVSQAAYLLKLNVTQELGSGKGIATFRLINRIGQTLGPVVFGWLIAISDFNKGAYYFGFFYLLITAFFVGLGQGDREIASGVRQNERS